MNENLEYNLPNLKDLLSKYPKSYEVLNALGIWYQTKEDNPTEALKYYKQALINTDDKQIQYTIKYNIGLTLNDLNRNKEALKYFEDAGYNGGNDETLWSLSLCYLTVGRRREGFKLFNKRYSAKRTAPDKVQFPNIPLPFIEKKFDEFKNKRVLVLNEQGFGDEIMFSRVLPHLSSIVKYADVQCYPETIQLIKNSFSSYKNLKFFDDRTISIESLKNYDCYTSTGNLFAMLSDNGFVIEHTLSPVNNDIVLKGDNMKIGICWNCNPKSRNATKRNVDLQYFIDIINECDDNINFYSLQKDVVEGLDSRIIQLGDKINNFNDTANIIEQLDYVITIDTSTAHLSGILNIPTFVLLNEHHDWRWIYKDDEDVSELYESVVVFDINSKSKNEIIDIINQ